MLWNREPGRKKSLFTPFQNWRICSPKEITISNTVSIVKDKTKESRGYFWKSVPYLFNRFFLHISPQSVNKWHQFTIWAPSITPSTVLISKNTKRRKKYFSKNGTYLNKYFTCKPGMTNKFTRLINETAIDVHKYLPYL